MTTGPAEFSEDELSRRWREETRRYVAAVNEFVRKGLAEGWEAAGDEPEDTREPLAEAVLDAVRRANAGGTTEALRERFPPAHAPFLSHLKDNGTSIPVVLLLDDGRVLARIGAPHEDGHVVLVGEDAVRPLPEDVITVGRSADRRLFAVATAEYVVVYDGWDGPEVSRFDWPEPEHGCPVIERLIPFPRGDRVLLISRQGVFVLTGYGAIRLLPIDEDLGKLPHCDMVHGTMSRDGRLVAAGYQSSLHYVFDGETYEVVAEVGHWSEYPHHAVFSADESLIAFNSCHFYSGVTIGVRTDLLPGLKTKPYDRQDERIVPLQAGARVYAAVSRGGEFIVGDANGYLRAFDTQGRFRWQHFIGSTVEDIDISPHGRRLVVSTYAGFLCFIDLDTGEADPFQIGTASHRERRRWLFWRQEDGPLRW